MHASIHHNKSIKVLAVHPYQGWQGVAKTGFYHWFNRFKPAGRNPYWQKLAKTQMTKTLGFLVRIAQNAEMCVWMLFRPIVHLPHWFCGW